jgi:hypothetical protein
MVLSRHLPVILVSFNHQFWLFNRKRVRKQLKNAQRTKDRTKFCDAKRLLAVTLRNLSQSAAGGIRLRPLATSAMLDA